MRKPLKKVEAIKNIYELFGVVNVNEFHKMILRGSSVVAAAFVIDCFFHEWITYG